MDVYVCMESFLHKTTGNNAKERWRLYQRTRPLELVSVDKTTSTDTVHIYKQGQAAGVRTSVEHAAVDDI